MKKLSVVIPAKNEEETLGDVLEDLYATIPKLTGYSVEVICVDDCSTDTTAEIAHGFGATVIHNESTRSGKGMALQAGFRHATGDYIVMLDADYSHRPEDLPGFLEAIDDTRFGEERVGLVIGSRLVGGSDEYTHVRALGNLFLTAAVGLCMGRYLSDALNGYKLFRREVFTDFDYTSVHYEIEIELIANTLRKGYRVAEVSSHERARAGGRAKSSVIRHGTRFLMRILYEGLARGVKPRTGQKLPIAPSSVSQQNR